MVEQENSYNIDLSIKKILKIKLLIKKYRILNSRFKAAVIN